jgi:hypothetical protein
MSEPRRGAWWWLGAALAAALALGAYAAARGPGGPFGGPEEPSAPRAAVEDERGPEAAGGDTPSASGTPPSPEDAVGASGRAPGAAAAATEEGTSAGGARADGPPPLAAQLRSAIRGVQPAIRACYEASLRGDERLAGRIVLELEVQPDGRVALGQVAEDELVGRAGPLEGPGRTVLVGCIEAALGSLEFELPPDTTGVTMVRYPIVLSPGAEGI